MLPMSNSKASNQVSPTQIVLFPVVPINEEIPVTSPFAEDSSKLNTLISGLPSIHHNRGKRQRREPDQQQGLPMVMYDGYEGNYINSNGVIVSPLNNLSSLSGIQSMQPIQSIQPMQMMSHVQMMPQNVPSVIPMQLQVLQNPSGVMGSQASLVQPVDGVMIDQQSLDLQSLQQVHDVQRSQESDLHKQQMSVPLKSEDAMRMDEAEKSVAYHVVHNEPVAGLSEEMDDKRVKELYV